MNEVKFEEKAPGELSWGFERTFLEREDASPNRSGKSPADVVGESLPKSGMAEPRPTVLTPQVSLRTEDVSNCGSNPSCKLLCLA